MSLGMQGEAKGYKAGSLALLALSSLVLLAVGRNTWSAGHTELVERDSSFTASFASTLQNDEKDLRQYLVNDMKDDAKQPVKKPTSDYRAEMARREVKQIAQIQKNALAAMQNEAQTQIEQAGTLKAKAPHKGGRVTEKKSLSSLQKLADEQLRSPMQTARRVHQQRRFHQSKAQARHSPSVVESRLTPREQAFVETTVSSPKQSLSQTAPYVHAPRAKSSAASHKSTVASAQPPKITKGSKLLIWPGEGVQKPAPAEEEKPKGDMDMDWKHTGQEWPEPLKQPSGGIFTQPEPEEAGKDEDGTARGTTIDWPSDTKDSEAPTIGDWPAASPSEKSSGVEIDPTTSKSITDGIAWPDGHDVKIKGKTEKHGGWKDLNTEWDWPQVPGVKHGGLPHQLNVVMLLEGATSKTLDSRDKGIVKATLADLSGELSIGQIESDYTVDVPGLRDHVEMALHVTLPPGTSCSGLETKVKWLLSTGRFDKGLESFGLNGLSASLLGLSGCPKAGIPPPPPAVEQVKTSGTSEAKPSSVLGDDGMTSWGDAHMPVPESAKQANRQKAALSEEHAVDAAKQVATQTAQQIASKVASATARQTALQLEDELRNIAQRVAKATAKRVASAAIQSDDGAKILRASERHRSGLAMLREADKKGVRYGP